MPIGLSLVVAVVDDEDEIPVTHLQPISKSLLCRSFLVWLEGSVEANSLFCIFIFVSLESTFINRYIRFIIPGAVSFEVEFILYYLYHLQPISKSLLCRSFLVWLEGSVEANSLFCIYIFVSLESTFINRYIRFIIPGAVSFEVEFILYYKMFNII
jgi:hypothetical protein